MAVTEAAIRKDPAAWLWIHDRWKTKPSGPSPKSQREESPEGRSLTLRERERAKDQALGRAERGEPSAGASAGPERADATCDEPSAGRGSEIPSK
jgi:hypothetical protein